MEQERQRKPARKQRAVTDSDVDLVADTKDAVKQETDELLDEIDELLEENAEEFVRNYIQKGGE
jgi:ubiquitin-like protein Pup